MSYSNVEEERTSRHIAVYVFLGVAVVATAIAAMTRFVHDGSARSIEAYERTVEACIVTGHDPLHCRAKAAP